MPRHSEQTDCDAPDEKETKQAKDKEAPLIGRGDERADQAVDNQVPGEKQRNEEHRSCHFDERKQREEHQGSVDEPLNISDILGQHMRITQGGDTTTVPKFDGWGLN